jgi:hypothetical protein
MGAGFAILPFARLLENSVAQAAGEMLPLKFVTIYHPHGIAAEYWALRSGETESSFDITYKDADPSIGGVCSLQPFDDAATYGKSFKDHLLVVEGIDLLSSANGHSTAGTILTGSKIDGNKPQNISLDQYLAVTMGLGADTRITSVNLGVGNDQTDVGLTLSYSEGGIALPKIIDPVQTFHLLFDGMTSSTNPAAQAAAARQRTLDQAVVDYDKWDVNRLRAKLGPAEQAKLDQHLTSLHEIEKSLAAPSMTGPTCVVPAIPDATTFPQLRQYNGGEPYFDAITNAQIDLLAQALACDVTRFATLFMNDLSYAGNPLNLPPDNHGSVAHTYAASPLGMNNQPPGPTPVQSTWVTLAKFNRYAYSKVARLMQKLDQLGALDSTIIYVSSDMGNPALHSTRNVPTVIAGGTNGIFKMGRHIKVKDDCPASNVWCENTADYTPTANSQILVAIAQAFGAKINQFGTQPNTANVTGALSALTTPGT